MPVATRLHWDPTGGREGLVVVQRTQDVEPILEANKRLYLMGDGQSPTREFRFVARIPLVLVEKWRRELGLDLLRDKDAWKRLKRMLNSNEYLHLRTAPGRLRVGDAWR